MPTSEIVWPSPPRGPIFQVYGTKRKADNPEVADPMVVQQELHTGSKGAKRKCLWQGKHLVMRQPDMGGGDAFLNNNNNIIQPPQMCFNPVQALQQMEVQSMPQNRVPSPWPQDPTFHHTSHNVFLSHRTNSQGDHVMDLNGETYSSQQSLPATMDEAIVSMDSDCVPDQQQYSTSHNNSSSRPGFCNDYCGAGDPSPTSGRIRCYCKPSWEGMMDMKPYISDVY